MIYKLVCKEPKRIDIFIAQSLKMTRNQVAILIKENGVYVNGIQTKKTGFRLEEGDAVTIPKVEPIVEKEIMVDFEIPILYEDEHILVINKPPFLTVHPAPSVKEATVVDWLRLRGHTLSTLGGNLREGIVHRIDKETSGALVIAKTNEAHEGLAKQLKDQSMGRFYLAIIDMPLKEDLLIDKPITRNIKNRLRMNVAPHGRASKSAFVKLSLSKNEDMELIGAKLFTGRTHQIRAHLKSLSRYILGDDLYGFKSQKAKIPRVMLHAYGLHFLHPVTSKTLLFCAPLYEDFRSILAQHFNKEFFDETLPLTSLMDRFNIDDFRLPA